MQNPSATELAIDTTTHMVGKIILVDNEKYERELPESAQLEKHWNVKVEYLNVLTQLPY